ncbi:MAG: metal-sulfur cluster assembly factor [Armatimonadetes bacterium]|nr:metal-sulfur cluster assembly factor [Armatimonadota bacterium]
MADQEVVLQALKTVDDPEVGVNVVDLGLIEAIDISDEKLNVTMVMTTPACPLHDVMKRDAENAISSVYPDMAVNVDVVAEPLWDPSRMTAEGRRQLGWPE